MLRRLKAHDEKVFRELIDKYLRRHKKNEKFDKIMKGDHYFMYSDLYPTDVIAPKSPVPILDENSTVSGPNVFPAYLMTQGSLSRLTIYSKEQKIPDILYCGMSKSDKFRLKRYGIRVGTKLYRTSKHLKDEDMIFKITIPSKEKTKYWREENFYVNLLPIKQKFLKLIYEKK